MFYNYGSGYNSGFDLMGKPVGGGGYSGGISLPGAPANNYSAPYGGIPQVPNPAATQHQAIQGNLSNAGSLEELMKLISQLGINQAGQVNQANLTQAGNLNTMNQGIAAQNEARNQAHAQWQDQFNQQQAQRNAASALLQARGIDQQNQEMIQAEMQQNVPGYSGLIGQRSHNISDELAGNVSDSTWNQLAQRAAERGASMGGGVDSPNANAALLAALGQTSEQQQALGANQLGGAIAGVPHAPLANVPIQNAPFTNAPYETAPYANPPYAQAQQLDLGNFLTTPQQQQTAQEQANWNNAMPIPGAAAAANMNAFNRGFGNGQGGTMPPYQPASRTGLSGGWANAGGQVPYQPPAGQQAQMDPWQELFGQYGYGGDQQSGQGMTQEQWNELFGQYGYGDNQDYADSYYGN